MLVENRSMCFVTSVEGDLHKDTRKRHGRSNQFLPNKSAVEITDHLVSSSTIRASRTDVSNTINQSANW